MPSTLNDQTIQTIKETAPVLQEHAETLTRLFYKRLFERNPEVRPYFNPAHQQSGEQQRALAGAIVAYATHIDKLAALGPAVELIAHKHASLGVRPEHYPIVGENLLGAISELLGEAATDEILDAWTSAYGFLAEILIQRESEVYQAHEARHGWRGFRTFQVTSRVKESQEITSFQLEPCDDRPVGEHLPGQYLTLRVPAPTEGWTMRNYSISSGPNPSAFRISVKKEAAPSQHAPSGWVSNWLHNTIRVGDQLEVGPPCGEFVLDFNAPSTRPLVLIAGGVGVTPLLSMLHAVVDHAIDRDVYFIHAVRNGKVHAFADEVRALAGRHPRVRAHVCYDEPDHDDHEARRFDTEGRVGLALLKELIPTPSCDFYFCGPVPFMAEVKGVLEAWGAARDNIRFEHFGPLQSLNADDE